MLSNSERYCWDVKDSEDRISGPKLLFVENRDSPVITECDSDTPYLTANCGFLKKVQFTWYISSFQVLQFEV